MQKETITTRQAICIITLVIFGSSVVMGVNKAANQDTWISLLLAMVMTVPVVIVYSRIIKLYPEKDIFDISEEIFGKFIGKIIIILISWYALHLGALVLRNFSEFIEVVAMPETPQLPLMIGMFVITTYIVMSGVETFAKWSVIAFVLILILVIFTLFLSLGYMKLDNILPVLNHSIGTIAIGSYKIFSFPFAETVLFLAISGSVKKKDSPYKIYLYGILIGGLILGIIFLRNYTVLGSAMIKISYFPSYTTARVVKLGSFLERIEGSITYNFVLAGITKITFCLFAAAKGTSKLFGIKSYKSILLPVSLLMLALSSAVYMNIIEMFDFVDVYHIYAIPFQIIIPLVIWIGAEIKTRKKAPKDLAESNS